ncbi:MAG: GHMP kinase [Gemmatimonadota bacterium]
MSIDLHERLRKLPESAAPAVRAYHRIDGPGSSLDLREFQQALWRTPPETPAPERDPTAAWSARLARTIAITIDTGTLVRAEAYDEGRLAVRSIEYETEVEGEPGRIAPVRENWLLKIVESFDLTGVRFVLQNLVAGTHSSGLGGSATATTGVALLANELAASPMSPTQIVGMASRVETEYGVSLTGTQEQSNVLFGGVVDYVWCPWGVPGEGDSGFGSSIRTVLVEGHEYPELLGRLAIFHTGRERASSSTNAAWIEALRSPDRHGGAIEQKLEAAYRYREGLRTGTWRAVGEAIEAYRAARTQLCPDYMTGADRMFEVATRGGGALFPLGAGGGGGTLVFHEDPPGLDALCRELEGEFRRVPFDLRSSGHELLNL